MAKTKKMNNRRNAVRQGTDKPGYGNPPKEYQWQPGESGNPDGPPKHRTNLWLWFCSYMSLTDTEWAKLDKSKLTASQQTALMLVQKVKSGKGCGAERMARYVVDREEGKAVEHLIIGTENELSDEECEHIRELIVKNYGDSDQQPDSIRGQSDPDLQASASGQGLSPQPG